MPLALALSQQGHPEKGRVFVCLFGDCNDQHSRPWPPFPLRVHAPCGRDAAPTSPTTGPRAGGRSARESGCGWTQTCSLEPPRWSHAVGGRLGELGTPFGCVYCQRQMPAAAGEKKKVGAGNSWAVLTISITTHTGPRGQRELGSTAGLDAKPTHGSSGPEAGAAPTTGRRGGRYGTVATHEALPRAPCPPSPRGQRDHSESRDKTLQR